MAPERDFIWLPTNRPSISRIIAEVAHRRGLSVEEIKSRCRKRRISHARQEAMWELRQRTKLSLPQIAERLNLKDHTTARHGILAHAARLEAVE